MTGGGGLWGGRAGGAGGFPDEPDGGVLPVAFAEGPPLLRFEVGDGAGRKHAQGAALLNLQQGAFYSVDAGGRRGLAGVQGGIDRDEVRGESGNPGQQFVDQHFGFRPPAAEQIQQTDPVDMPVDVVGDDDERPFREVPEPFRVPDAEIDADVIEDAFGERGARTGRRPGPDGRAAG